MAGRLESQTNRPEHHKDALDLLRLLRAVSSTALAERFHMVAASDRAGTVAIEALARLPVLFGTTNADGVGTAIRAAGSDEDHATTGASSSCSWTSSL